MADMIVAVDIQRVSQPLFRIDPGWLFLAAGLVAIAATILIPAHMQLHTIRENARAMDAREAIAIERLAAYSEFMVALDERDPKLLERIAAAQLNLKPAGKEAVLVSSSATAPVNEWIDSTLINRDYIAEPYSHSRLVDLTIGKSRQWLLGGAAMCIFIGLLISPHVLGRDASEAEYDEKFTAFDNDLADLEY